MRTSGKFFLRLFFSCAISVVFIWISLRHTDLAAVGAALTAADPGPILLYLVLLLGVHVVKTLRWGVLLQPIGAVSFRRLNSASAVGFMLMVLLPLRLGELARPLLVSRPSPGDDTRLPRAAALASCLVERIVDFLVVGALGIVSLYSLSPAGDTAQLVQRAATLLTAGFAALCVGLTLAFFKRQQTVALLRRLIRPLSPGLAERASHLIDRFIGGLSLGSPASVLWFLTLTVAYWALHVWGFWALAQGFGFDITPLMTCTVIACQVVGFTIPAGPGSVGTSQFFTQLGLSIFVPASLAVAEVAARAVAYSNTIWFLQVGQQVVTGVAFLALGHVSLRGLFDPWEGDPLAVEKVPGE
jgi:uncharacterized protein (TIRG00374 family)